MRTPFIIVCLLLLSQSAQSQKSDDPVYALKLELLKPLTWVQMGGYVIEPEFSVHHNKWAYNITMGFNNINADEIYRQLDYNNTGWHGQAGVQYKAVGFLDGLSGLYFGININMAKFKETGTIIFEGEYFDDYQVILAQTNTNWGMNWLTSIKLNLGERIFTDFTARIAKAITQYKE
ncbi:MAG: hypothetical protein WD555_02015, partial [Fulvivirga sp.]